MKAASHNRGELGRFLRSRRERLNPADVGFPTGPRRRSRGLRREEVAVLAGLSPTWYTYLEQGRDIRPSPEVVDSLARVLCLTEDERRYVHTLAYGHVARPLPLASEISADELLHQVIASYRDCPLPVFATSPPGDLLAWNPAATEWYDDWGALPAAERNLVRWLLVSPTARGRLVDWEVEARDAVARLRTEAARWPGDEAMARRVAELAELSPEFGPWWDEHIVRERRSRTRCFRHPVLGLRELRLVPMQSPEFAPAGVVLHLAA
ncbi:helix-turn-helix transcriptional regulator [Saccharothrix obliqua]|uniref:helix-turn-helix transcriptional regulator n=1 Tax=Saccharothrix obliqua TaxID=2861747 RepID=UPI001C5D075B|nr:helix-turn-helix transcriptional regulator [Saccharothrix obliqua]MBW4717759.1 helix-turn-helix transcriptional regulator [Saccharothrix obliqua]